MGGASSHAFSIRTRYPRAAESYQFMAGGSVATRCRSPLRALEAAAVCDAAKGSARRHLSRLGRFLRPLEPTDLVNPTRGIDRPTDGVASACTRISFLGFPFELR